MTLLPTLTTCVAAVAIAAAGAASAALVVQRGPGSVPDDAVVVFEPGSNGCTTTDVVPDVRPVRIGVARGEAPQPGTIALLGAGLAGLGLLARRRPARAGRPRPLLRNGPARPGGPAPGTRL